MLSTSIAGIFAQHEIWLIFWPMFRSFPQLVAGPIERGSHLLPQFAVTRNISFPMIQEGCWLFLWGMFKKVVLADNLAPLVEMVYGTPIASGPIIGLATLAFGLQIYCDFSGYSDIARGTAKVLGFDIMLNFNLPYTATDLRDFWRRWHISLSTWLRDYLYISLGGSRMGTGRVYLNLFITMLLGGLWHGASLPFVLWGLWHGLGLIVQRFWSDRHLPRIPRSASWLVTLLFVFYGWLLFRAGSTDKLWELHAGLLRWNLPIWTGEYAAALFCYSIPLILMQLWQKRTGSLLAPLTLSPWSLACLEGFLLIGILLYWEKEAPSFIYFQF